jgi:hypothetical protein
LRELLAAVAAGFGAAKLLFGAMERLIAILRCYLQGRHRWRVPDRALLANSSDRNYSVRCSICGRERVMTGDQIQRRSSGGWEPRD